MSIVGRKLSIPWTSGSPKFRTTRNCIYSIVGQAWFPGKEHAAHYLVNATKDRSRAWLSSVSNQFVLITAEKDGWLHPDIRDRAIVSVEFAREHLTHEKATYE